MCSAPTKSGIYNFATSQDCCPKSLRQRIILYMYIHVHYIYIRYDVYMCVYIILLLYMYILHFFQPTPHECISSRINLHLDPNSKPLKPSIAESKPASNPNLIRKPPPPKSKSHEKHTPYHRSTGYLVPGRDGPGVWPDGRVVGTPPSPSPPPATPGDPPRHQHRSKYGSYDPNIGQHRRNLSKLRIILAKSPNLHFLPKSMHFFSGL